MNRNVKVAITIMTIFLAMSLPAFSACSPRPIEGVSDNSESLAATVETTWSPDIDCAVCHSTEASTSADSECLAGHHTITQGFTCVTCHTDDGALTEAHADMNSGTVPKKLKNTEVSESVCITCHDKNDLAQQTAASTVLTDQKGTIVNPHELPQTDEHASLTCTDCHKGHSTSGVQQDAPELCVGCHHDNVYECGTCHE